MTTHLTVEGRGTHRTPIATRRVSGGGGVALHLREWGVRQGAPILFIHGWSQSQDCWRYQVHGDLADRFHLVTFDLRGHGMSEKPAAPDRYTNARVWADDVAAVIDATGLDRPVLVGWSYGGFVATDFVGAYGQDSISGMNLVGGAVLLHPPTFDHFGDALLANAEAMFSTDAETSIPALLAFLRSCSAAPLPLEHWSETVAWNMTVPPHVRQALIARQIDADGVLSAMTTPVLVTHGRADEVVLPSMAEHVTSVCPTAKLSWFDGVGHMPFVEDPERFDRELADFATLCQASTPSLRGSG
jgi:pimeloyl-ACP methyl ester carboxylesterase